MKAKLSPILLIFGDVLLGVQFGLLVLHLHLQADEKHKKCKTTHYRYSNFY
jgi:hypothetical protein